MTGSPREGTDRSRGYARFAGWAVLAAIGQAASLQLVDAGTAVGYQHYAQWSELLDAGRLPWVGILLAQAGLVAFGLRGLAREIRAVAAAYGSWWRLAAAGALLVLTSATLSADPSRYLGELALASALQLLHLATVVLAAVSLPASAAGRIAERLDAWRRDAPGAPRVDRFALLAAGWAFLLGACLAWFVWERHPHIPDEVAYLHHARYFARGMLAMPAPPVAEAFPVDIMTYEPGRWYSPVPPGWPAVLAAGVSMGFGWLVNPLLNGVNVVLAHLLVWRIHDRRSARLSALLLCASPWFVYMGMNLLTHTLALAAALAAALAVAVWRERHREGGGRGGRLALAAGAGIAVGVVGWTRPLEGLAVAVILGAWALGPPREWFRRLPAVATMAVACLATVAPVLPYNAALTGDPATFPIMAHFDATHGPGSNALGFGPERGLGWTGLDPFPGHGPLDVLINGNLNAFMVNVELFGWASGSLLLVAVLLFSGRMRRRDLWMVVAASVVVIVHVFYWFSGGPDFGARYWYLILPPCVVLTVRGAEVAGTVLADVGGSTVEVARARVWAGIGVFVVAALLAFFPWRAIDKYHGYRGMRPDVRVLASDLGLDEDDLVLVRGRPWPDDASAAAYNPPVLTEEAAVYAWDAGPRVRRRLLRAYADRDVWVVLGPSITGGGYRLARGPVPAASLRRELDAGSR